MSTKNNTEISSFRLRIGFILIFLWWAPFWALAGELADIIGTSAGTATLIIVAVQTTIGLIGMLVVGKQVAPIVKKTSFKKSLGLIWFSLIHGKLPEQV